MKIFGANRMRGNQPEKKRVVIIEDDADLLCMLELMLTDAGYNVSGYSEPSSLEDVLHLKPDCFILDDGLPYVSGHTICIILKSNAETCNIPVILTSASDKLEYVAGLSEPEALLKKPFDSKQLLETISLVTRPKHD